MSKLTLNDIRELAYYKWEEAGCPEGQDSHFWALAKEEYLTKHDPYEMSGEQPLDEDLIREFQDEVDWTRISVYQHLSEDFIREFQDKVSWYYISKCQELSEDFIREFQNKVEWYFISKHQNLSEGFIREFNVGNRISHLYPNMPSWSGSPTKAEINWYCISKYQYHRLSEGFIKEFKLELMFDFKKPSREEKIEKLKHYYEIIDNKVIAYKTTRENGYSFYSFRYLYEVGKTYESSCDCSDDENSFGLSAWTKQKAIEYGHGQSICLKLFKVEIDLDDIGAIVHDCSKLRCFKFKVIEEVDFASP